MVEGGAHKKRHASKKSHSGFAAMTVEKLRKLAKKKHIKLSSNGKPKKKSSLVAALRK